MRLILLGIVFALAACANKPVEEEKPDIPEPANLPVFEQGLKALDQQRYNEAASIFDRLLVAKPATEHDLVTTYNSAAAYEGLGNCPRAGERYREVVRGSAGKFRRIEGQALYRLGLMYECLGMDVKEITALIDARRRGQELSFTVLNAEIPARLAAAYARLGNRDKAMEYFAQASKGLKKMVSQETGVRQAELLGNSLYLMGQLNPTQRKAEGEPFAYLEGLSMQQAYLLQAIELHHPNWSRKAAGDLELAYENIGRFKLNDPAKQAAFNVRALQVVAELKRIRLPKPDSEVDPVFQKIDQVESRLNIEVARSGDSTKLTPEAEKRQALKQQGRLVNPVSKPAPKKR